MLQPLESNMTDNEFDTWAERKYDTFQQWVYAYFVRMDDEYWRFKARQQRSVAAWLGLMAESPCVFNQEDGTRTFTLHTEEYETEGNTDCLFIYFRFTAPDGQQYEPTEGMMINTTTGEMSYI